MASYGEVGVNVGTVGRWARFVLGILIIAFVVTDFYPVTHAHSTASYLMLAFSFAGIIIVYTLVHITIGDKLRGKSAWWGTLINVCFSPKRTFRQVKSGNFEGPLTATSGRSSDNSVSL